MKRKKKQTKPAIARPFYIVDESKLQMGDIIVTTTADKISRGIRILTRGDFSHVIIYAGVGYYIDATNDGVQSRLISRMLLEKPDYCKVLRLKNNLTEEERVNIVGLVRYHIGKEYSVPQAIMAGIPFKDKRQDQSNRQFCSRLIAEAYSQAGYSLVKNDSFCTPQEVSASLLLTEVSGCIREATQAEIFLAQAPDEGLVSPMQKMQNDVLLQVRELTNEDIQEFTSLSKFAATHPNFDQGIADILKNTGYLDMWKAEYEKNQFLYDANKFKSKFSTMAEQFEAATYYYAKNESVLPHYSQTYNFLKAEYAKHQSLTLGVELALYEKLLELYEKRKAVLHPHLVSPLAVEMDRWGHLPPELLNFAAKFF